jgi:hypothetical protein
MWVNFICIQEMEIAHERQGYGARSIISLNCVVAVGLINRIGNCRSGSGKGAGLFRMEQRGSKGVQHDGA